MKPCECGCGVAVVGRFVSGHNTRLRVADRHPTWVGDKRINAQGYVTVADPLRLPERKGRVREHVLVVETALGKRIPRGAEVHHLNGIKTDNRPENLVLCQDRSYHKLIERRQRSMAACGRPDFELCGLCGGYDSPSSMRRYPGQTTHHHGHCWNNRQRAKYRGKNHA